jgi:hypothetical protein
MRAAVAVAALAFVFVTAREARAQHCALGDAYMHRGHDVASSLDVGVVWTRFDNTTTPGGWQLQGEAVRFGWSASVRRHAYIGAELDVGTVSGTGNAPATGVPGNIVARTAGETMPIGATGGKFVQVKVVAGLRTLRGPIRAAVELAGGARDASIGDTRFTSSTSSQTDGIIEARGRVDLWLGRGLTIGGIAGINMLQRDNIMVGAIVAFHVPR